MVKIMAPISFNNYRAVHHKVRGGCVFDFFFWAIDEDLLLYFHKGRGLVGDRFKKKTTKKKTTAEVRDAGCLSQLGARHSCFVCERFALQQTATFKTVKGRAAVTTLNSQEIQRERKSLKKIIQCCE